MLPHPLPPRASVWEWAQTALLAANLAWTTLCLGGYRAETMVVTSALNALMLGVHFGSRAFVSTPWRPWHPAGLLLLPFLVYAWVNVLWVTPVRWLGWHDWLEWSQMIAVFWVVVNDVRAPGTRKVLFGAMVSLATVAVAMACYQRFVDAEWVMLGGKQMDQYLSRPSGALAVPNSLAGLLVLLLPVVSLPLWRRGAGAVERVTFGYLAALLLLGLGLTLSRGAWLALAVTLALWPLISMRRRWSKRLGVSALVAALALGALATVYVSVPKARERVDFLVRDLGERSRPGMWRAAWNIFCEFPAFGSGAGSYEVQFEKYRPEQEQKDPQWAHNDYLNTLSDYGAVGFGLFFGAVGVMVWCGVQGRRTERAPAMKATAALCDWSDSPAFSTALAMGLLAFGQHLAVDFHLKIPALAMSAAAVAGLALGRVWLPAEPMSVGATKPLSLAASKGFGLTRWSSGFAAIAIIVGGVQWAVPHYRAEALRREARLRLDGLAGEKLPPAERRAIATAVRDELARALAIDPSNAQAWADRAYAAAALGRDEARNEQEFGRAAESDARRALALTAAIPEYWVRLGVALDLQGRWFEAGEAFTEALQRAPLNATVWYYHAYHLSLNRVMLPLARAAIATSLRLDPYRTEAESLRQNLAARR